MQIGWQQEKLGTDPDSDLGQESAWAVDLHLRSRCMCGILPWAPLGVLTQGPDSIQTVQSMGWGLVVKGQMPSKLVPQTQLICPTGPHCRLGRLRTARAGGPHLPQLRGSGTHRDELESVGATIKPELEITAPESKRVRGFSFLPTKAAWHKV